MAIFARQQNRAKILINKYGQSIVYKSTNSSIQNINKPWIQTDSIPTQYNVKMIFLSPSDSGNSRLGHEILKYLGNTDSKTGELRGYLEAGIVEPKLSDIVERSSKEMKISYVDKLDINGEVIFYILGFEL